MNRRDYIKVSNGVGLISLTGFAGCPENTREPSTTSQRVADDWTPGPGEWAFWPGYGPRMNRYNPNAEPPRNQPSIAWKHSTSRLFTHRWLAIANGKIIARTEAKFHAIDTSNGQQLWKNSSSGFGSIIYVDGRLYHSTRQFDQALSLDGDTIWTNDNSNFIVGETAGKVFADSDSGISWHDPETGARQGNVETDFRPVMATGGRVYGRTSTKLAAFTTENGKFTKAWEQVIDGPFRPYNGFVLAADRLYVRERDDELRQRLEIYNLDGEVLDRKTWPNQQLRGIIFADGVEYRFISHLDDDGEGFEASHLIAFQDSEELWRHSFEGRSPVPVISPETIVASDGADLLALDKDTGEQLWELPNTGGQIVIVDDSIYVNGQQFYRLRA